MLLQRLELRVLTGRSVTVDARHPQRATSEVVPARGGASVRALQGKQGLLDEEGRLTLPRWGNLPSDEPVDGTHGRRERPTSPGLAAFGKLAVPRNANPPETRTPLFPHECAAWNDACLLTLIRTAA